MATLQALQERLERIVRDFRMEGKVMTALEMRELNKEFSKTDWILIPNIDSHNLNNPPKYVQPGLPTLDEQGHQEPQPVPSFFQVPISIQLKRECWEFYSARRTPCQL